MSERSGGEGVFRYWSVDSHVIKFCVSSLAVYMLWKLAWKHSTSNYYTHVQSIFTYHTSTIHTIYHTNVSKEHHQRLQESTLLYMHVCLCAYKANVRVSRSVNRGRGFCSFVA